MAEAALNLEEYFVTEDCIACDACCNDFPDIFKMNAEHTRAMAVNTSPVGKHNPWEIVTVCPVDAIKLTNMPMPPKPEGEAKKEEAPAAAPTSMVGQINAILQARIVNTKLAEVGVTMIESPSGGVFVYVGLNKFESIDSVPDEDIKAAIRSAIAEWERKYTPGL